MGVLRSTIADRGFSSDAVLYPVSLVDTVKMIPAFLPAGAGTPGSGGPAA